MSDGESSQVEHKKRRLQNACDHCRIKKIKCDSSIMPEGICTNCISSGLECTHVIAKKKRGRPGSYGSQQKRSIRDVVEAILSTAPSHTFVIPNDPIKVRELLEDLAYHVTVLESEIAKLRQEVSASKQTSTLAQDSTALDIYNVDDLTKAFRSIEFDPGTRYRHYGDSSHFSLIKTAMDMKKEHTGDGDMSDIQPTRKRPQFWAVFPPQWQKGLFPDPPLLNFPPHDFILELVDLYFSRTNHLFPLLHRPSFLNSISNGLHHKDRHFGTLLLAVCALGARYSDDSRIFEENSSSELSIGWKWIRQIQPLNRSYTDPPSLYEIQMFIAYIMFMLWTSTPEICSVLVCTGLRLIQVVGAHRKQNEPTVETESWKTCFWCLYSLDIFASASLGRPRSVSYDEFDLDMPIDCDHEYWQWGFQQPQDKPSTMSFWIYYLKLMSILESILRAAYPVKNLDIWSSMGMTRSEWLEHLVADFDSSLNNWVDSVPEHLKWDPNRENLQHFDQSVVLYSLFYRTRILVHQRFITSPSQDTVSSFPSLEICCNAARSWLQILAIQQHRKAGLLSFPTCFIATLNAAMVLLINVWRKRHFQNASSSEDVAKIHKSIDALHQTGQRWQGGGLYADVLLEVASLSGLDGANPLKRPRSPKNYQRFPPDQPQMGARNVETISLRDVEWQDSDGISSSDLSASELNNDDWTSYMASVDEILRKMSARG